MNEKIISDSILYILDYMNKNDDHDLRIQFHGGEPLLEFDKIVYTVENIKKHFNGTSSYAMTTNGTIINKKIAKFLFENRFDISVSIDGDKKSHDINGIYLSGEGSFDDTYEGLTILKEFFYNFRARMTICKNTVNNLYDNVLYFINLGATSISCVINMFEDWTEEELALYQNQMYRLAEDLYNDENYNYLFKVAEQKSKNSICDGGSYSIHILPNGDIYPCTFSVENIKYKIGDIYNGIDEKALKKIHDLGKIKNEVCEGCQRYHYCTATRCKLINEIMTGNPHLPDAILCELENISININKYYNNIHK